MSTGNSIHDILLSQCVSTKSSLIAGDVLENGSTGKKAKLDIPDLKDLQFTRILKVSPTAKRICIECQYQDEPAILILEKTAFEEEITQHIADNLSGVLLNVKNLFRNDIFGTYLMNIALNNFDQEKNNLNQISVQIIHPARSKDIEKYIDHPYHLILETAQLYETITKPFIDNLVNTPGHLQWLYNVLERKAETDRIVYEENTDNGQGFMLVKDMKWKIDKEELSESEKTEIYINALVMDRNLHTLRDLTDKHLPLLEGIYSRGREAIATKFGIDQQQLRVFIHYQPSFYHLHIHFTHIKNEHGGFQTERAHLLSAVIENIRLCANYYQRVAIEYPLSSAAELKREQYNQ